MSAPVLAAELRFRPAADAARWRAVVAAVAGVALGTGPTDVTTLSDVAEVEPRPWTAAEPDRIALGLAGDPPTSYLILTADDGVHALLARDAEQVKVSLRVRAPAEPPVGWLRRVVEALEPDAVPEMAMLFDPDSADDRLTEEGLSGLTVVPPVLYLSGPALTVAGGEARLREAPGEAVPIADGVALALGDPLAPATGAESARLDAAAEHLGISPELPLSTA
ncbi:MAG TPA: hypothetical protein VGW75_16785 [Solirubrobacteraceae bacterium]|jgi:hypothetical protein|nr:hypothetical protein [Solirubrobacteraceae bacterium]